MASTEIWLRKEPIAMQDYRLERPVCPTERVKKEVSYVLERNKKKERLTI